jgi:hypothetical protein
MMHLSCLSEEHEADHDNLINTGRHYPCNSLEDVIVRLDGFINTTTIIIRPYMSLILLLIFSVIFLN